MEPLPIDAHLGEVVAALRARPNLVLCAEPGAGKTTRVPPALVGAGLAGDGDVVVLEPRRLAARMAARRVAEELGEPVGERVGYQVRFEEVGGPRTRIRFVTEGILTRRLAGDPSLRGVSVVVLDEFHERHLHADLALALLRRAQVTGARADLCIVVMSATLDAEPIARFLDAAIVRVPGRRWPVSVEWREPTSAKFREPPLGEQVAAAVRRVVSVDEQGDVLVFLPGAAEIRQAQAAVAETAARAGLDVVALHGDLPAADQDRAVRRGARRKIILSTNVAETSITIPGVVAVIDSGLARVARHSPWSGLPSLETVKVSRAAAEQRAGRAGRTGPGRCLRLYSQHDWGERAAHDAPEVRRADLAETALALHAVGVDDVAAFPWFEAPPAPSLAAAEALLGRLGSLQPGGQLTAVGRRLVGLPLHPRLGRLVVEAEARGVAAAGCVAAAVLGERDLVVSARTDFGGGGGGRMMNVIAGSSDLTDRVEQFLEAERARGDLGQAARARGLDGNVAVAVARARDQVARAAGVRGQSGLLDERAEAALRMATLAAFPDRVARRRTPRAPEVLIAGGTAARLAESSVVHDAEWLVALDAGERRGGVEVRLASAIEPDWLIDLFPERVIETREVTFVRESERVEVVSRMTYEGLVLDESRRSDAAGPEVERALAEAALAAGPGALCDADELARLRARVAFAAAHGAPVTPLDEEAVRATIREMCAGIKSFAELREASLPFVLRERLGAAGIAAVERMAPERVALPGGRRARVEYAPDGEKPPWVESRLQDFFGAREGPRVADGRVPLVLHLLAPNQRAVQVTTDLAGFWQRHYPSLRRELMRRYPRHAWPEDPTIG